MKETEQKKKKERNWAAGKSSIFGTLAFLITKLVSLLSGRTVVWLVYNWGLFHLWVMGMSSNWLKQKKRERDYIDSYIGKFREILGSSGMGWPQRLNSRPQECVAAVFCVASFPLSQANSFYKVQRWPPATSDLHLISLTPPVGSMYFSHSSIISAKVSRVSCKHPRVNHNPIQEAITVTSISQACTSCPPPEEKRR